MTDSQPLNTGTAADRAFGHISIGVDIGGTKTLAVAYSRSQGILARAQISTNRYAEPATVLDETANLVNDLIEAAHHLFASVPPVGIGVPGLVDRNRVFTDSIILPTWHYVDVAAQMSRRLNTTVFVDNDATMAAMSLALSSNPPSGTVLCLTLGTGVGAAILTSGQPLRGPDGTAGQLGHMTIDANGRRCPCGSKGCLNAYVSGSAIAERYIERLAVSARHLAQEQGVTVTGKWVAGEAERGNADAREIIEETARLLGVGLASLSNIFNPEVILLTGGVSSLGETLLGPAHAMLVQRSLKQPGRRVRLRVGRFGAATGAVGAALSAWTRDEPSNSESSENHKKGAID